jgi:3-hydroxyacyl-CoA dehydrogenase
MGNVNSVVSFEVQDGVAVVTVDSPPVNALGRDVRDGIFEGIQRANADAHVSAIVLACAGKTFIAGADIREFGQPPQGKALLDVLDTIEYSPKPVVAALHGTVLGGGLEVALCAHFRVAADKTRFGLPEVKLGLLAGSGGTQRLPRVVGAQKALDMMLSGDPIGPREALAEGLIDELASGDLRHHAVAFARRVVEEERPLRRLRDESDKLASARENPELFVTARKGLKKGSPAPEKIVQCVEAAVQMSFEDGMRFERAAFVALRSSPESAAQRYYFFAEREAAKIEGVPMSTPQRKIEKVGILGAGTMGGGIAMNFLNLGLPVVIVEQQQEALDRGVSVIRKNYERTASKGKLTAAEVERRMGLLTPTLDFEALRDCDLVIEAVFELMSIKQEVFGKLDRICKPGAVLATNTSYLDVNDIAKCTSRPADVLGLHFFSPANVMKLLEIVRGKETAKDVIATAMGLGKRIGKIPVLVGVCRGFVGNRILAARQAQAQELILEGAMPWDVDRVIEDFGIPMGPFAMTDLAGVDIGWDPKNSQGATNLRHHLCEIGRKGQKTGAGYYKYDPQTRKRSEDPEIEALVRAYAKKSGREQRAISDQEILERCLYAMVNEGAKILEEGIAARASDIDVVWVNGYGFPAYRGGLMYWAQSVGLSKIVESLKGYEQRLGPSWKPAALLERLAAEGKGFTR